MSTGSHTSSSRATARSSSVIPSKRDRRLVDTHARAATAAEDHAGKSRRLRAHDRARLTSSSGCGWGLHWAQPYGTPRSRTLSARAAIAALPQVSRVALSVQAVADVREDVVRLVSDDTDNDDDDDRDQDQDQPVLDEPLTTFVIAPPAGGNGPSTSPGLPTRGKMPGSCRSSIGHTPRPHVVVG